MSNEQTIEFVPLLGFEDSYEILNKYPFTIRNKGNHRVIKEGEYRNDGYINVVLNNKKYQKHRLIALQFIPNPDNLPHVDHINHIKTDNRIENLRWSSSSDNNRNLSSRLNVVYKFVDDIPDDSVIIDFYETTKGRREFEANRYYYYFDEDTSEDIFYMKITDDYFKELYINIGKNGIKFVRLNDKNNKKVSMYINKFKQQHDL